VLVPKSNEDAMHRIFIAEENHSERHFEPGSPRYFSLDTDDLIEVGIKLKALGKSFSNRDFFSMFRPDDLF